MCTSGSVDVEQKAQKPSQPVFDEVSLLDRAWNLSMTVSPAILWFRAVTAPRAA